MNRIPMRWPNTWRNTVMLGMLRGTPVNCLVLDAANPALEAACRPLGISCTTMAELAPLSREKMNWNTAAATVVIEGCVWPGIQSMTEGRGATTGPTRTPWLDSNGWFLQLARTRLRAEDLWLLYDPQQPQRPEQYALAVADAAAHGGRWVISLDKDLAAGLASRNSEAMETWRKIAGAMAFFGAHEAWTRFRPLGVLAVVSDFAGENQMLAEELLNLMARRQLAYRIVEKSKAESASFAGFKAIVAMDAGEPPKGLREKLLGFAAAGGVLIVSRDWKVEGREVEVHPRFRVLAHGQGRVAVSTEESPDPYVVAADAHILLSHANDLFRLHNLGSLSCHYCGAPDGKTGVLHLVNYSTRRRGVPVTVWMRKQVQSAKLWTLGSETPVAMKGKPEGNGFEYYLEPLSDYAALELNSGQAAISQFPGSPPHAQKL